jgi:hypothetical protein
MITVWEGNICRYDQALQLLLIIDYIFDWARDIYRPLILSQLSAFSIEQVLRTDADIGSIIEGREMTWTNDSQESYKELNEGPLEQAIPSNSPWDLMLVPHGVIRDASVIETRLMGLVITEDDIEALLLSFPSEEAANSAISLILGCLKDSWRVKGEALVTLEAEWTEEPVERPLNVSGDEIFYFKVTVQMFVGLEWEPVRQMTYLSVSESAIAKFVDRMTLKVDGKAQTGNTAAAESKIINHIRQIKQQSVVDNLRAAISMVSFSNTSITQGKTYRMRRHGRRPGWKNDNSHIVVDVVTSIYEKHRIGRRRPTDEYLRFSCARVQQTIRVSGTRLWQYLEPIKLDKNGCVLVDGVNTSENMPKRCLYIVRGYYDIEQSPDLVKSAFERGLYYTTMQLGPEIRPEGYFNVLNQPTTPNGYWMNKGLSDEIDNWVHEIQQELRSTTSPALHEMSPITISSDEEPSTAELDMETD